MNVYAYHPSDPTKKPVHMDEWMVEYGPDCDGCCRICNTSVFVKGDKSQKQTHFAHYKDSGCPTVIENHKPYDCFKNLPRDPALAESAKEWAFQNIDSIYEKLKKFVKALSWLELHDLLEVARREDIWSLKGMPHDYIPYVLLTCTSKFEANKKYRREKSCCFVLEPSPESGEFWNSEGIQKRYLWEITLPSKDVVHHQIKLETPEPWYMHRINDLLS
ncbi:MAG: hypothetical protein VX829_11485 [Pseudomonadota bacterium]|uniref:hypothetical protein n=1 Tax=Methylophaga aminisulfidivorans TaxID=230105 RepID=UPI0024E1ABBA|nr:hypothetical protein [Methylophaga aminisulfidivorans]MEC9413280.1 hypothetical protein [Pseudomonadota bacterium]